ncbi:MAG: hypothetical protein AAB914_00745, partial [Patescibacteria group bacterium]
IGGYDGSTESSVVYFARLNADGTIGSWLKTAPGSFALRNPAAVVANGWLYVMGGTTSGVVLDSFYSGKLNSDGSTMSWSSYSPALPGPRAGASAVAANGYIYLMGGTDGTSAQTTVYYAQPNTGGGVGAWTLNPHALPSARDGFGSVYANGYIYAVAGNSTTAIKTVYYASLARTKVAGSLDLVGITSGSDPGSVSGGNLTAGNTNVIGTLTVRDQVSFTQGLSVGGGLNVQSGAVFRNGNNINDSFQVQNAGGAQVLNINTTNTNLVNNGDFETNINGWNSKGGAGLSQVSSAFTGLYGLGISSSTLGDGATYAYKLLPNTQYTLKLFIRGDAGDYSNISIQAGYSTDGATDTSCASSSLATGTEHGPISCTFTTGGTITGSPYIYVKQTNSPATPPDMIEIDTVTLTTANSTINTITLNGVNSGELGAWATTTAMPLAREKLSTVVANGYIYEIGGSSATSVRYAKLNANGTIGTWSTSSTYDLPLARQEAVVVTANGYLYVIGGYNGSVAVKTTYYAKINSDGSLGEWRTNSPDIPAVRSAAAGFVANGYVYVTGGADNTPTVQSTIYYAKLNADGTTGSWLTNSGGIGGASATRALHTAAVANGYVYIIGGIDGSTTTQSTVGYGKLNADGTITGWGTGTAMTTALDRHTSTVANGYLYVIGGESTYGGTKQAKVYYVALNNNGSIGDWITSGSVLSVTLMDHATAFANGYIYALGGNNGGGTVATAYYSSLARLRVGGSLDLVGLGGQNLAEGGTGGTLTAGDTNIVGILGVQGQASFAQGLSVD